MSLATLLELPTKSEWEARRSGVEAPSIVHANATQAMILANAPSTQPVVDPSGRSSVQDVQPILERSPDSIWSRAETIRDGLWERFQRAVEERGYHALVIKSAPFEQPAQVRLESWIPRRERAVTARRSALVTIEAKEFHRYSIEYTVELHDGHWSKSYARLSGLSAGDEANLIQFALGQAPPPSLAHLRLRRGTYDLWRPKNKVTVLRAMDWLGLAPRALAILGVLLVLGGLGGNSVLIVLGLLLVAAGGVARYALHKRRALVRSSGKPQAEPRRLVRIDSWQAVVSGLGGDAEVLRTRLLALLDPPPLDGLESRVEQIWYWGLDGTVERTQILLTLRRAWVFCQIYAYDEELYVGWDAHLNRGQWVEKTVATGVDKATGELTHLNTVESGWQSLSEYDVIDLNCVSEWFHARLVQLVQRLMDEREIDQEIDFKIIRGDRASASRSERESEPAASGARAAVGRRLKRTH